MKRYHVLIHPDAEGELDAAYRHIAADAPARAAGWRRQLLKKARSLKTFPDRCHKAPAATTLGEDVRHLVVGNYRIIFVIQADTVTVLHIRHGARLPVGAAAPERSNESPPALTEKAKGQCEGAVRGTVRRTTIQIDRRLPPSTLRIAISSVSLISCLLT